MDVGRNLTLTSEQDSDNYDSKQRSGSVGASGSMGGGSGSLNLSQSKMHSTWRRWRRRRGFLAGEGGFGCEGGRAYAAEWQRAGEHGGGGAEPAGYRDAGFPGY
ncbi:COG3210: Large exoproteins involved in heme utilization or adhesion [Klebsiella pneumoniae IS53]|nr:COG3210: Large exoproteins involved in heme utilization or adhesion [Klebsiella pneumoniae IS53]